MNTPIHPSTSQNQNQNRSTQSNTSTPKNVGSRTPITGLANQQLTSASRLQHLSRVQEECQKIIKTSRQHILQQLRDKMTGTEDIDSSDTEMSSMGSDIHNQGPKQHKSPRHPRVGTPSKAAVVSELAKSIITHVARQQSFDLPMQSFSHDIHGYTNPKPFSSSSEPTLDNRTQSQRRTLYGPELHKVKNASTIPSTHQDIHIMHENVLNNSHHPTHEMDGEADFQLTQEELSYLTRGLEVNLFEEFTDAEIEESIDHSMGEQYAAYSSAMDELDDIIYQQVNAFETAQSYGVHSICPKCLVYDLFIAETPSPEPISSDTAHRDQSISQFYVPNGKITPSEPSFYLAKCSCGFVVKLSNPNHITSAQVALETIKRLCETAYFSHLEYNHGTCRNHLSFAVNRLFGLGTEQTSDSKGYITNEVCLTCQVCNFTTGTICL